MLLIGRLEPRIGKTDAVAFLTRTTQGCVAQTKAAADRRVPPPHLPSESFDSYRSWYLNRFDRFDYRQTHGLRRRRNCPNDTERGRRGAGDQDANTVHSKHESAHCE